VALEIEEGGKYLMLVVGAVPFQCRQAPSQKTYIRLSLACVLAYTL
jgi:hypothetical protein